MTKKYPLLSMVLLVPLVLLSTSCATAGSPGRVSGRGSQATMESSVTSATPDSELHSAHEVLRPEVPSSAGDKRPTKKGYSPRVDVNDGSTTYPGVGARIWPVSRRVSATAGISADRVVALLKDNAIAVGIGSGKPSSVTLAEYENQFGSVGSNGVETPSVPRQPAWIVLYENIPRPSMGGPAGVTVQPTEPADYVCTLIIAVRASDGGYLDAFDYCSA